MIIASSPQQTLALGASLARQFKGGDVVALTGNLGAGKTTLIQGIAAGLGIKTHITSPTFVLLRAYPVRRGIRQLVHVDGYRVHHPRELLDVGLLDYLGQPDTVTVIEWPQRLGRLLPSRRWSIKLAVGDALQERKIAVAPPKPRSGERRPRAAPHKKTPQQ